MKPQLQLSAGQNPTITSVTNHTNENDKTVSTSVSTDNSKTQSNMEETSEPFRNGASVSSPSNGTKHNGAEDVDINLESEERDEFIDIKVLRRKQNHLNLKVFINSYCFARRFF